MPSKQVGGRIVRRRHIQKAVITVVIFRFVAYRTNKGSLVAAAAVLFGQVPEGLLSTVTICLMIASRKMYIDNVLVRKLDATECLGCINILACNRTGTLTQGDMKVVSIIFPDTSPVKNHLMSSEQKEK